MALEHAVPVDPRKGFRFQEPAQLARPRAVDHPFGETRQKLPIIAEFGEYDLAPFDRQRARTVAIVIGHRLLRSEERSEGHECVSTGRSRWSPYNYKKKNNKTIIYY